MFLKSPPWCHILNIHRGRVAPSKSREPTVLASPTASRPLPRRDGTTSSRAEEQSGNFLSSLVVFLASSNTCEWDQCGSEKGRMEEKGFDRIPR
jgi:hypothetical protein